MSVEKMLDYFAYTILWNPLLPMMFLGLGLYVTIGMRFFQFRRFGAIFEHTILSLFRKKGAGAKEEPGFVSSFGAFATALGGTVGSGNVAGVSSAIALGGPGALFWMWISALVGMATKMGEIILAQHYKETYPDGTSYGGCGFYVEKGLVEERGWKWARIIAWIFSISMVATFFTGVGTFTIAESVQSAFHLSKGTTIGFCFAYTALLYVLVFGGIPRIVKFAEYVVPFMVLFYIVGGVAVILFHGANIVPALRDVVRYAFTPHAAVGGFAGVVVMKSFQIGVARSVYSNEAGWGSSPMIHAAAKVDHPARQGMWGAMEVFVDTMIVCTVTGLVVLTTGIWQNGKGGAGVVATAFGTVFGEIGPMIIALSLILFQVTTSTGWYSYLESLIAYFSRRKTQEQRRALIQKIRFIGPLCPLLIALYAFWKNMMPSILWLLMDIQTAIPVYMNLLAIVFLSPLIFRLTKEFEQKYLDRKVAIPAKELESIGK
ncbi:MAG: alanine/glycine:cation symporter family protein [Synergistales bacterium]|jgi:AGCS family alanine or glycine:cation symporter